MMALLLLAVVARRFIHRCPLHFGMLLHLYFLIFGMLRAYRREQSAMNTRFIQVNEKGGSISMVSGRWVER
jgi:hypothetical protein